MSEQQANRLKLILWNTVTEFHNAGGDLIQRNIAFGKMHGIVNTMMILCRESESDLYNLAYITYTEGMRP